MKWYAKIVFSRDGVEHYQSFDKEETAKAFVDAFTYAKDLTKCEDSDPLEEYFACYDQLEPLDEQ